MAGRQQQLHLLQRQHTGVKSLVGLEKPFPSLFPCAAVEHKPVSPGLLLHPGQSDAADEIFLEEDKDQQHGQGRDHRAGEDDIPDGLVFEDKQRQSELQGAKLRAADDDQRPEEIVPDEGEGEDRLSRQDRTTQRQNDLPVNERTQTRHPSVPRPAGHREYTSYTGA